MGVVSGSPLSHAPQQSSTKAPFEFTQPGWSLHATMHACSDRVLRLVRATLPSTKPLEKIAIPACGQPLGICNVTAQLSQPQ
jgi:hypothetical protein